MRKLFTMKQASDEIGVSYGRMKYAVITGVLHPLKVQRSILFTPKHVEEARRHFAASTRKLKGTKTAEPQ